jgi:hypothetical protein
MITTNTEIIGTKVVHTIKHEVEFEAIENIVSYFKDPDGGDTIHFENATTEEEWRNLMDYTGVFKYSDCSSLLEFGILQAYSVSGESYFELADGGEEIYNRLKRSVNINHITND